jgi:hypothetical protein
MVTPQMAIWFFNVRNRGLASRATVLAGVAAVAAGIAAPVAWRIGGGAGVTAAAAAAGMCLAGAGVALTAAHLLRGPRNVWAALLVGMAARTGIPLIAALAVQLWGGPLAEAGLLYYVLIFYPSP